MSQARFVDPGKEHAVLGFIASACFEVIPEASLIPAAAFYDEAGRVIYRAACSLRQAGKPVIIDTVNAVIEQSRHQGVIQKGMEANGSVLSWEQWWCSDMVDCSLVNSGERIITWTLSELYVLHRRRQLVYLGERLATGDVEPEEAGRMFADFLPNGHKPLRKKLADFYDVAPDKELTLLGNRYLCRQGGMLFIGPSGMGKSSAAIQMSILWSIGKPAFGIAPARALKILLIQAEDDEGDLQEMVTGVARHLKLSPEDWELFKNNCEIVAHKNLTGQNFLDHIVAPQLEASRPDLLFLNPLQAYLGADIMNPEKTGAFLRNGLNPLLERYNLGAVVIHHTPKTNFRSTEAWKASDWMYAGAGSADITNWARAILVADPTEEDSQVFRWVAAKRGGRIGWADEDGEKTIFRYFKHSGGESIHWEDSEEPDPVEKPKGKGGQFQQKYSGEDILKHMDLIRHVHLSQLRKDVMLNTGMSKAQFYRFWNKLVEDGKVIAANEEKDTWRRAI